MLCYVMLCCVMRFMIYVMWCRVLSCYVNVMPCHVMSCNIMSCDVMVCYDGCPDYYSFISRCRSLRGRLDYWLIDWLSDWLFDWLIVWLVDWLTDWLTDWLIDWLIDWSVVVVWLILLGLSSHVTLNDVENALDDLINGKEALSKLYRSSLSRPLTMYVLC